MNTPVTFELAKLLKEKGFNEDCLYPYLENGNIDYNRDDLLNGSSLLLNYNHSNYSDIRGIVTAAPTIAEVVMWLYEKHGVYIHISPHGDDETLFQDCKWWFSIYKDKVYNQMAGSKVTEGIEDFKSRAEAYEAAIEYSLTKLILNTKESVNDNLNAQNELEYWKKRCELAEAYINESPCDTDIHPAQLMSYTAWNTFKKESIHICKYSRSMNQPYPRLCVDCGKPEVI